MVLTGGEHTDYSDLTLIYYITFYIDENDRINILSPLFYFAIWIDCLIAEQTGQEAKENGSQR